MKRAIFIPVMLTLACSGCLHSPPTYPGAGGDNVNPSDYVDAACPDLNGKYEGKGELVEGDAVAQSREQTWRIDRVFPYTDSVDASAVQLAAQLPDGRLQQPLHGSVSASRKRVLKVVVSYPNGKTASYEPTFEDKAKFVCTGRTGKIIWGGPSQSGRSEFGPNHSDAFRALYLDHDGALILERGMQVHMSMFLGAVPTGTAKRFSKYKFRRIQ
ncbi:hypothetical protein [Cupriavidus sp. MP-37]|uniref:hypothetical protein n=1 Tax=Cupriavidus sp. MP-37 TaxID=2884455 RepID=UPI001D0A2C76|nr:hypothetical protein [Cupriavidus sp. MP-37]UDM50233.1 hypothetical protein LIN44_00105 [Cupriavidus sp. MP-37]